MSLMEEGLPDLKNGTQMDLLVLTRHALFRRDLITRAGPWSAGLRFSKDEFDGAYSTSLAHVCGTVWENSDILYRLGDVFKR